MTTTQAWLEAYGDAKIALVLLIEGYGAAFTTADSDDAALLAARYDSGGSQWDGFADRFYTGLDIVGELRQEIKLFAQDIDADSLEFTIVDPYDSSLSADVLAGSMLRERSSSAAQSYVTSNQTASSTANLTLKDVTSFAASGSVYVGWEKETYTSKTGAVGGSLNGIGRGASCTFTTQDGTVYRPSHNIADNVSIGATTAPAVSSHPRSWYGRPVSLMIHHYDPIAGLWSSPDDSRRIWVGRIRSYGDDGMGRMRLSCSHIVDWLKQPVMAQQWKARINEGVDLTAITTGRNYFTVGNGQAVAYNPTPVGLGTITGRVTHDQMAAAINTQLGAWQSSGDIHAGDRWSLTLTTRSDGTRVYMFQLHANTTSIGAAEGVWVAMHPDAWVLLGFAQYANNQTYTEPTSGAELQMMFLDHESGSKCELIASESPVVYEFNPVFNSTWYLTQETGTWVNQPAASIPGEVFGAEGCIRVGDDIFAVIYSPGALTMYGRLDPASRTWGSLYVAGGNNASRLVRLGEASEAPEARQVWYERGGAGTVFSKLLISTGSSGFNDATYDAYTGVGFGLGVPYSLVDVPSFLDMDDVDFELLVDGPTPLNELLEPVLAVSNRYVVWKSSGSSTNPKITVVRPSYESAYQSTWALTESNKSGAGPGNPDRTAVDRGVDGIVNRVVLEYGHDMKGQNAKKVVVEDLASQSDFGRRRTITIKATNVLNAANIFQVVVAPAVAYLSRPLAIAERSIDFSLVRMAPGDSVSLTDNSLVDPATGTRGATVYAWVTGVWFDWSTGKGSCQLVFLPEKNPTLTAPWAPSARVDEGAAGSGYNAGTKTLTFKAHEFSDSTEAKDISRFAAGDSVRVRSLDEAAPLQWVDTIASVGTDTCVLTTGLAGYDTAKRYVLEYDDISTVANSAQRNRAFIADDADLSTGYTTPTPYQYGVDPTASALAVATPTYTQGLPVPNTLYDDKGEPYSVDKLAYVAHGINNLLAYKTSPVYCSDFKTIAATTNRLVYIMFVPHYGHASIGGVRGVKFRVRGFTSAGTATFTVVSSPHAPQGISFTSFTYPGNFKNTAQVTTTSTTSVWMAETTLTPVPAPIGSGMWGTWFTVQASGSGGTATFNQIMIAEAELP